MFEAVFRGNARAAFDRLDLVEQARVRHLIRLIELQPSRDGGHKAPVVVSPLVLSAFDNGAWQVTYRTVEPFVEIYGIRRIA
jgi:hypothetical protein